MGRDKGDEEEESMAAALSPGDRAPLHPFEAILLAGSLPLFLGVLLADMAYGSSYEIQWKNFASWLIVGALVLCGFAVLWALIGLLRPDRRGQRRILYLAILLAAWILGFINALVHAKDAWASMPAALILSAVVAVLAIAATGIGFSSAGLGRRP
jgi:uncharacterized membrane protein